MYESLEEYLDDNIPVIKDNIELAMKLNQTTEYLNQMVDSFYKESSKKREYYIDIFLEEYSEWGKKGEQDPQRLFVALYATSMQLMIDYYKQCETLAYLTCDDDDE